MKTIVVSGARSSIGKTACARFIGELLPASVRVKIGHGEAKPADDGFFYHAGTPFREIANAHAQADFLILESNRVLEEISADLVIYLTADKPKPSAAMARSKADIVRGERVDEPTLTRLGANLGLADALMRKIVWYAGARPQPVNGCVLAGGKSSRMGTDKALLAIGETTMVGRCCSQLAPYCDQVLVAANRQNAAALSAYNIVIDREDGRGPLMGIAAGLAAASANIVFVAACDIPFIDPAVICRLLSYADDYEIVVPSFRPKSCEPLYGVYHKSVVPAIEALLREGMGKVSALFDTCATKVVAMDDGGKYANLNTPREYSIYRERNRACTAERGMA